MSCKLKSYSCVTCHKRMKKDALRFLKGSQNRSLRHFLGRTFVIDIDEKDAVCNKCRQLYYSSNQTGKQVTNESSETERVSVVPSIVLPIPSAGYRHDACVICSKKPRKLVKVNEQSRQEYFISTGVFLSNGARCCPCHITGGYFSAEAKENGILSGTRNQTTFSNEDILKLLENLRCLVKSRNERHLDFDADFSLTDEDYKNLTGLTRTQFDDLMTHVKDIKHSKSRSIRSCVAILLVKLKCALDNKILATLFNMKKWQVKIHFVCDKI